MNWSQDNTAVTNSMQATFGVSSESDAGSYELRAYGVDTFTGNSYESTSFFMNFYSTNLSDNLTLFTDMYGTKGTTFPTAGFIFLK